MRYNGIAISGKAGAGKDAFGEAVREALAERGVWSTRVGFADALKEDVFRLYGLTKSDPGGREKLVEYSNAVRANDPSHWIARLARHIEDSLSPYGLVPTICDLRYENEYRWAREESGMLVVRVDALRMDRLVALVGRGEGDDFVDSEHESEVALDDFEFDVRFWNPHGGDTLRLLAQDVADLFDGTVERIAA